MNKITIQYFRRASYGRTLEYVVNPSQASIVQQLTGQKTIDARIRNLVGDLTRGGIVWEQVADLTPE